MDGGRVPREPPFVGGGRARRPTKPTYPNQRSAGAGGRGVYQGREQAPRSDPGGRPPER